VGNLEAAGIVEVMLRLWDGPRRRKERATVWKRLLEICEESRLNDGQPACLFVETLIFNEGWLLRSVLKAWKTGSTDATLPFLPFAPKTKVYSEGQLRTPFAARFRGDPQAESHSHVDGIVGHFLLAAGTKSGIRLMPGCRYVAAFEAKLYSPMGKGTRHAPAYDQVSRTAACLVHALLEAGPAADCAAHLVVLYPADHPDIDPDTYAEACIRDRIANRLKEYQEAGDATREIERFAAEWERMIERVQVSFVTWEAVLAGIGDDGLLRFYDRCKEFNRK
jgi:hypothetical protein